MIDPANNEMKLPMFKSLTENGHVLAHLFECLNLLDVLDDPVLLGPIPQRDEFSWNQFVCVLKVRPMIRQDLTERHSIRARAIWIGAASEQKQRI